MKCHWCDLPPAAACIRCGRFYCLGHGGEPSIGPLCQEHTDAARDEMGCLGVVAIAAGLVWLGMLYKLLSDKAGWGPSSFQGELAWLFGGVGAFKLLIGSILLARSASSPPKEAQSPAPDRAGPGERAGEERADDAAPPEGRGPSEG